MNLKVTWRPDGCRETDWVSWDSVPGSIVARPANELLFLHEFGALQVGKGFYRSDFSASVNEHLLVITAALIRDLAERLAHTFEVRFLANLELEWEPLQLGPRAGRHVLGWSIVTLAGEGAGLPPAAAEPPG